MAHPIRMFPFTVLKLGDNIRRWGRTVPLCETFCDSRWRIDDDECRFGRYVLKRGEWNILDVCVRCQETEMSIKQDWIRERLICLQGVDKHILIFGHGHHLLPSGNDWLSRVTNKTTRN